MVDTLPLDALDGLLDRARVTAEENRVADVGWSAVIMKDRVVSPSEDRQAVLEHPGLDFVVDNGSCWVRFSCRVRQRGQLYRRDLMDGHPDTILNADRGWQFSHPGDSLHIASDPTPVPHRRRSSEIYWLFLLPPVLPTSLVPTGPALAGVLHERPVWQFTAQERDEFTTNSFTVAVDRRTGLLRQLQHAVDIGPGDIWTWSDLQRNIDLDPVLFQWDGPDRSLAEVLSLRDAGMP